MDNSKASTVLSSGEMFIECQGPSIGKGKIKIKIGDGSTKFKDLAYLTDKIVSDAMTECGISIKNGNKYFNGIAARVEHTLKIGPRVYDGSADVTIPVYSGE